MTNDICDFCGVANGEMSISKAHVNMIDFADEREMDEQEKGGN